MMSAQIHPWN